MVFSLITPLAYVTLSCAICCVDRSSKRVRELFFDFNKCIDVFRLNKGQLKMYFFVLHVFSNRRYIKSIHLT